MNRDIKFRGKQSENGEWIYGSVLIHNDEALMFSVIERGDVWTHEEFEVIPKTVGQYIGLKIGKEEKIEIFEGDVLKMQSRAVLKDRERIGVVKYDKDRTRYICEWKWNKSQHHIDLDCDIAWEAELLGNLTDNPELKEKLSNN